MKRETVPIAARLSLALALGALLATAAQAQDVGESSVPDFETGFAIYDIDPLPHDHPDTAVDIVEFEPPLEPATGDVLEHLGRGHASYYGRRFAGRPTASGERFNPKHLTAAHRTLPFGSMVRVTNPRNGRSVVVRINDRGPFVAKRTIDLSRAAAEEIGLIRRGVGEVELELLGS